MTTLPFTDRFLFRPPPDQPPRDWHLKCLRDFRRHFDSAPVGQFRFLVSAGVGSGKTYLAAMIAADVLNRSHARRVVYVCPNRAIKRAVRQTFERFNIYLTDWSNRRHSRDGEGVFTQGAVLTYQSLASRPEVHTRRCHIPTLVIFDEIHHLGDRQAWDVAARAAFEHPDTLVLGLSGTPYRADNRAIPFVDTYLTPQGLLRFRANFTYTLGRAVTQGICRRPSFRWLTGEVDVTINGDTHRHFIGSHVQEELAGILLGGAVRPGAPSRIQALREALALCQEENNRKLIIFVGGDSGARELATEDAETLLPAELVSLGVSRSDIVSVTSASPDAVERLHAFGGSSARVLVTVNMVSEGVDIPQVSAALFLTSITAKATTIQRIGRTLRGNDPATAVIFMFRDPRYVELAEEVEDEINHEINLRRQPAERDPDALPSEGRRPRVEAIGLDAHPDGLTVNGRTYTQTQVEQAHAYMAANNLPSTDSWLALALQMLNTREGRP